MRSRIGLLVGVVLLAVLVTSPGALAQAPVPPADGELVSVALVIDGDTILVERDDGTVERVRYIGIDTPELSGNGEGSAEGAEPYSRQAAFANASLVEGKNVLLETDTSDRDIYDRLLRYVWVETEGGWAMVNERLVALGLADVTPYEPDIRYNQFFLDAEESARRSGRGKHDVAAVTRGLVGAEAMAYLFMDAYDARDAATLRRLMSNNVVYESPDGETYRGKKAVMGEFRHEWGAWQSNTTIRSSIAQPEAAVLELTIHLRPSGPPGLIASPAPDESFDAVAEQDWSRDKLSYYRLSRDD